MAKKGLELQAALLEKGDSGKGYKPVTKSLFQFFLSEKECNEVEAAVATLNKYLLRIDPEKDESCIGLKLKEDSGVESLVKLQIEALSSKMAESKAALENSNLNLEKMKRILG